MLRTTQRIRLALLEVMDLIGVHAPRLLAPLVNPSPALAASLRTELREQLAISERAAEKESMPQRFAGLPELRRGAHSTSPAAAARRLRVHRAVGSPPK